MPAAEEGSAGKGRGVRSHKHVVLCGVNEGRFLLREPAPEEEHNPFTALRYGTDYGVSKLHPAYAAVGCGLPCLYGKDAVEEEHPLACPAGTEKERPMACPGPW